MELTQNTTSSNRISATIAASGGLSGAIQVGPGGFRGLGVVIPAEWTAADLGILVSDDDEGAFVPLYDEEGERVVISGIATDASRLYLFPASVWAAGAWAYVKLASLDTSDGSAEDQGAARAVTVVFLR